MEKLQLIWIDIGFKCYRRLNNQRVDPKIDNRLMKDLSIYIKQKKHNVPTLIWTRIIPFNPYQTIYGMSLGVSVNVGE